MHEYLTEYLVKERAARMEAFATRLLLLRGVPEWAAEPRSPA